MRRIVTLASAVGTGTSSTAAETSLAQYAFGVGELTPGRLIRYECLVTSPTVTAGGDTLRLRVRFGTSATASANTEIAVGGAVAVAATSMSIVRGSIHIQSTIRYVHTASITTLAASGVGWPLDYGAVYVAVADTAYYLDVTGIWSTRCRNISS